ncbi:uncharacterized protein [Argopecten irradians]|uniref:uncharacterized protein n=1 Tax=Argopecten irradians TaxID=31199 RepID=UPI0037215D8E
MGENWRRWSQRLDVYLTASGSTEKSEATQVAILLHTIGEDGMEIYNNFVFANDADKLKWEPVLDKFQEYCNPRKNTVIERYMFWETKQKEGESIDHFVTELKTRAKNCEFGDQTNMMIRDRLIFGIDNTRLKERLLRDSADPTLDRVVEICRASEASARQIKEISEPGSSPGMAVHVVNKRAKHKPSKHHQKTSQQKSTHSMKCSRCGTSHKKRECPAYGKNCLKCGKQNHFRSECRSRPSERKNDVHDISVQECDGLSDLFIGELQIGQIGPDDAAIYNKGWFTNLKMNEQNIKFKLDTGAEANVCYHYHVLKS